MKNSPQSPQPSEHSERSERPDSQVQEAHMNPPVGISDEQAQVDILIKDGFVWDEAIRLVYFRDHLYSNGEMRQRVANDHRMQFMRWLYEQGELQEEKM